MKNFKNIIILLSVISTVSFAAPAKKKNAVKKAPPRAAAPANRPVAENSALKRQLYQALQLW